MSIRERIRQAIEESGSSRSAIAKQCGVSPSAVTQWLNGDTRAPTAEKLLRLARATRVSYSWLIEGKGDMRETFGNSSVAIQPADVDDGTGPPLANEVEVPLFREVELAAGGGRTQVIENNGCSMRIPRNVIQQAGVPDGKAACATLRGTSMEPLITDGSTVGVDTSFTQIVDGEIYAFDHDGMLRVKYLYRLPMRRLRVVSENNVEYPDEFVDQEESQFIRIIGRVFWWQMVRPRPAI